MEATTKLSLSKSTEKEVFWKGHYQSLKISRMSRAGYCKKHHLNYHQFNYWVKKWNKNKLIPVKIKAEIDSSLQNILCTVALKNGLSLKIHDTKALSFILEGNI